MKQISITESLNALDNISNNKYDLLSIYRSLDLSRDSKRELAEKLNEGMSPEAAADYLSDYYESDFNDSEVVAGKTFIADGIEYEWVDGSFDYDIHIDFDHWQVWSAKNLETNEIEYFVVDPDVEFIDWGPCSKEEAIEFLNGKMSDDMNEEYTGPGYYKVTMMDIEPYRKNSPQIHDPRIHGEHVTIDEAPLIAIESEQDYNRYMHRHNGLEATKIKSFTKSDRGTNMKESFDTKLTQDDVFDAVWEQLQEKYPIDSIRESYTKADKGYKGIMVTQPTYADLTFADSIASNFGLLRYIQLGSVKSGEKAYIINIPEGKKLEAALDDTAVKRYNFESLLDQVYAELTRTGEAAIDVNRPMNYSHNQLGVSYLNTDNKYSDSHYDIILTVHNYVPIYKEDGTLETPAETKARINQKYGREVRDFTAAEEIAKKYNLKTRRPKSSRDREQLIIEVPVDGSPEMNFAAPVSAVLNKAITQEKKEAKKSSIEQPEEPLNEVAPAIAALAGVAANSFIDRVATNLADKVTNEEIEESDDHEYDDHVDDIMF